MLWKQHRRATDSSIEVGGMVFSRIHDCNSKLDPLFSGTHRVIESFHGPKVKILDLKTLDEQILQPAVAIRRCLA